jgi:hypothetical protein
VVEEEEEDLEEEEDDLAAAFIGDDTAAPTGGGIISAVVSGFDDLAAITDAWLTTLTDGRSPLSAPFSIGAGQGANGESHWSLANMVLCLLSVGLAIAVTTQEAIRKRKERHSGLLQPTTPKRFLWVTMAQIAAVLGTVMFAVTQSFSGITVLIDAWSIVYVALLGFGIAAFVDVFKSKMVREEKFVGL